ncbi:hypothetical protein DXG01_015507 [Tephrocybe rancida]|nr:hypothetical protein DXG01_015507 [Tephrocybe rancida]
MHGTNEELPLDNAHEPFELDHMMDQDSQDPFEHDNTMNQNVQEPGDAVSAGGEVQNSGGSPTPTGEDTAPGVLGLVLGPLLADILFANGRGVLLTPKAPLDNKPPNAPLEPSRTEGAVEAPGDPDQQTQDPASRGTGLNKFIDNSADTLLEPDKGKLPGQGSDNEEWEDPGQEEEWEDVEQEGGQQGGVGAEHGGVLGPGEGPLANIDNLTKLMNDAMHTDVKIVLDYIQELQSATLDSQEPMLGSAVLSRLKHPLTTTEVYDESWKAALRRHPDDPDLSYYEVKNLLVEITGVVDVREDMCIDSCVAFTGPYHDAVTCPTCGQDPLDSKTKKPRQQFNTIPSGPQLQALKRHLLSAIAMKYRQCQTETLQRLLRDQGGDMKVFDDILSGTKYHEAINDGRIQPDDIVVMLLFDGTQLFENKPSDCWIGIWIILDISPKGRYKLLSILPAFTIPGPKKPRVMDSFLFTTFYHLAGLQKDGFCLWDASEAEIVTCRPFFALGTADGPVLTHLNGLVGHMGMNGCRLRCGLLGRHQPGHTHYYPVLLKPVDPVEGCNHDDVDWAAICLTPPPSLEDYLKDLARLVGAKTDKDFKDIRRETGIVKPSIVLGLSSTCRFPITRCFGPDIMHLICLNIPDLFVHLWRGTIAHADHDSPRMWPFAVFRVGNVWKRHGKIVATATPFLPGSFDRPPRDPAAKMNSGYKAWEFLLYLFVLGLGVLYDFLPPIFYTHFCGLIYAVQIINQHRITKEQLEKAIVALAEFVVQFEVLYYQRCSD